MSKKITDKGALANGLVWALLRYSDGSEFCFQTTLNSDILNRIGIVLEEGCLVRLDKQYVEQGHKVYRQFSYAGTAISLWDSETYTDKLSASLREFM